MSESALRQRDSVVTAVGLIGFFALVALFLGPGLFEKRTEGALWYALHIAGGSLVLLLGPFQFIASVRNRFRRYHRIAGYAFAAGSVVAVIGYIGLPKQQQFLTSQLVALVLWVACLLLAVLAIRAGRVLTHQHNMVRAFVLACYFLTVRIVDRYAMGWLAPLAADENIRLAHSDWLAWLIPLLLVEIYFTFKWQAALRGRAASR